MASRRTIRKRSRKGRKGKTKAELKKLLKKAQTEVEKLLKDDDAGTLTRRELTVKLEEIAETLEEMEPFEDRPRP